MKKILLRLIDTELIPVSIAIIVAVGAAILLANYPVRW